MARKQSVESLAGLHAIAGDTYTAKLVFAFRMFEIQPREDSAREVIDLIPRNGEEDRAWHSLNGLLCDQESVSEIKSLGALQERLPHDLAKAINHYPDKMYEFVSYAYDSIQDPHSDYAIQMQSVCRNHHERFMGAVNQMSQKDRKWFTTRIFDASECRAIALPEADQLKALICTGVVRTVRR